MLSGAAGQGEREQCARTSRSAFSFLRSMLALRESLESPLRESESVSESRLRRRFLLLKGKKGG